MTLISNAFEQDHAHGVAPWTELQHSFERLQEAYVQTTSFLQKHRQHLNQQTASIEPERLSYEQEQERFWNDRLVEWEEHGGCEFQCNTLRERMQRHHTFSEWLLNSHESFLAQRQAFQERLAVLREERARVREIADHAQQQEGYRQLQAAYRDLQQVLQEYRQLLREQKADHFQRRLASQTQLR